VKKKRGCLSSGGRSRGSLQSISGLHKGREPKDRPDNIHLRGTRTTKSDERDSCKRTFRNGRVEEKVEDAKKKDVRLHA